MTQKIECQICIEKFNNKSNIEIICKYCKESACQKCIQTYIITKTTGSPMCMYCSREWDYEFQVLNFTPKFINTDLKERRKNMLLAREQALLPKAINIIVNRKNIRTCGENINKLHNEMIEYKEKLNFMNLDISNSFEIEDLNDINWYEKIQFDKDYTENYIKFSMISNKIEIMNKIYTTSLYNERDSFKKLVKKCPHDNCKGYLNTDYECILCLRKTCKECGIKIDIIDDHKCKKQDIQNRIYLDKNTTSCPKCGTHIEKSEGCNDMWCILCHTPFNYQTGDVIRGRFHNPEYDKYKHKKGFNNSNNGLKFHKELSRFFNFIRHYEEHVDIDFNYDIESKLSRLRINFIEDKITENQWKINILRHDKKYQFLCDCRNYLNEFVIASSNLYKRYSSTLYQNPNNLNLIFVKFTDKLIKYIDIYNHNIDYLVKLYGYKQSESYKIYHVLDDYEFYKGDAEDDETVIFYNNLIVG